MRSGNLDRVIQIQSPTGTNVDFNGTVTSAWTTFATLRAQKLENAVTDREGVRGDTTDYVVTFRTRWLAGMGLESRVVYESQQFKIMSIKEIGRHVGLDITCERVGPC